MDFNNRGEFLRLAGLVEGGTIILALALGWLCGVDPWASVSLTAPAVVIGLLGTLPIFVVYALADETRSVAVEMMGPPLSRCRWYDLVLLAAMAGIGEELLFRGVLQPWLSEWSPLGGLVAVNVLFGLVHMVTPTYALVAAGIGLYLSLLAYQVPQANLLSAMIAHGVYDYVAFLLIVRESRASTRSEPAQSEPPQEQNTASSADASSREETQNAPASQGGRSADHMD